MQNKLVEINNQNKSAEVRFFEMYNWLNQHNQTTLAKRMVASGITKYEDAIVWFEDYYINDENEGYAKAQEIKNEIVKADPNKLYYSNPDFSDGYEYTPSDLLPVDEYDLQVIMDNATVEYAELARKTKLNALLTNVDPTTDNFDAADFIFNLYATAFNYDGRSLSPNYMVAAITETLANHAIKFVLDDDKYNVFELDALRRGLDIEFNGENEVLYRYELESRKSDIAFAKAANKLDQAVSGQYGVKGAYVDTKKPQAIDATTFADVVADIQKQL